LARTLRSNQAVARQAIYADLRVDELGFVENGLGLPRVLKTNAQNREMHLGDPKLGAQLSEEALLSLKVENTDVQVMISDGLSAEAVHHNMHDLLPVLFDGLMSRNLNLGQTIVAPFGRVKLAESIGLAVQTRLVILLIGERPGGDAQASRSLSAYLAFRLDPVSQIKAAQFSGNQNIAWEYTVVSNIYQAGLPPLEAGSVIAEKALQILDHAAAGNRLEHLLKEYSA